VSQDRDPDRAPPAFDPEAIEDAESSEKKADASIEAMEGTRGDVARYVDRKRALDLNLALESDRATMDDVEAIAPVFEAYIKHMDAKIQRDAKVQGSMLGAGILGTAGFVLGIYKGDAVGDALLKAGGGAAFGGGAGYLYGSARPPLPYIDPEIPTECMQAITDRLGLRANEVQRVRAIKEAWRRKAMEHNGRLGSGRLDISLGSRGLKLKSPEGA